MNRENINYFKAGEKKEPYIYEGQILKKVFLSDRLGSRF
jgi:hypothetical protein